MQLVSFDTLRVWDIPGVKYLKPEAWQQSLDLIRAAHWVLFPEYWQINWLVYGLKKNIFPSLSSYSLGYSKIEMTYAFQVLCPQNVPYTRILARSDSAVGTILDNFPFPFVAKTVRSARGRGVYLIENEAELLSYVAQNEMLYVQEYLPIERDLRVVFVGDDVVTAYWRIAPEGGFHNNVSRGGSVSFDDIPAQAIDLVRRVAVELKVNHAGFDVAVVNGRPYLLEFNMRFGNQALREQKIRLGPLIYDYLRRQAPAALPDEPSLTVFPRR